MVEDERLDTFFELNVKGLSAFSSLNITGTITAMAGGTASRRGDEYFRHFDTFFCL